jgi:hypothetical protein
MGEIKRRAGMGFQMKALQPDQSIQVSIDLSKSSPKLCECGCKYFIPVMTVYIVSALMSPTGQQLTAQVPVLVCMECKAVLKK